MAEAALTFDDLPVSSQDSEVSSKKLRRPPTITPKRFTRFFTPRSSVLEGRKTKRASLAARCLRDITRKSVDAGHGHSDAHSHKALPSDDRLSTPRRSKRQKIATVYDSSPVQYLSSPCDRASGIPKPIDILSDDDAATIIEGELDTLCQGLERLPTPVNRVRAQNQNLRLLGRSFGGRSVLDRGVSHDSCVDPRHAAASLYSSSQDAYDFHRTGLPFCAASCNTNSLVAFGDENGNVHLVDSSEDADFSAAHISFQPHDNAIMDLAFSSDDYLLASASGDQSARVIDMRTQQVRYILAGHMSTVKQVRFQPGNDSVIATSSRDGSVQIWDVRCRGTNTTAPRPVVTFGGEEIVGPPKTATVYAETCIAIRDAHSNHNLGDTRKTNTSLFTTGSSAGRRNEVSITAITFLPQGREHFLLSASEANSSVKVWDIRGKFNSRRGPPVPVSSTSAPPSHLRARHFGLNSLVLGGDSSRLYALCRDSTVYAYSTQHVIYGQAAQPDTAKSAVAQSASSGDGKGGASPLYGFKHPSLKVSSFYIKAALRKAKGDKEEMLAIGGRDGEIVCFPTDETHINVERGRRARQAAEEVQEELEDDEMDLPRTPTRRAGLPARQTHRRRTIYRRGISHDALDTPIYNHGTALVRGHKKEVTGVTWTAGGQLVSVSDDWTARCWREGDMARQLRTGGEGEGARWNSGWADVDAEYDEDDD